MFEPVLSFFKSKYLLAFFIVPLALNIAAWLVILYFFRNESGNVVLHYNILYGTDYRGEWRELYIIPGVGLAILLLNAIIGKLIQDKEKFVADFLFLFAIISQIFAIIAIAAIVLVNKKGLY